MIPIPPDYDKAQAYDGSPLPQVTPGGHICLIKGARLEKSKNTNKYMLVVAFDIHENGEFDDIYKARFERAKNYRADAKWPGMYYCLIYNNEGGTNSRFKGFIQAVEESNTGYNFRATNGDENTLKGKVVGFNFGEEERELTNPTTGEIRVVIDCKPAYAVSVARIREGVIPPARKLLQNSTARGQNPNAPFAGQQAGSQGFTEVEEDDLPF